MIRCKITPRFTEAGFVITVEWVDIAEGEVITRTIGTEEFAITSAREGCAYVTRGGFDEGRMQPGTFWIDEAGRRHFVMDVEAGAIGLTGEMAKQELG